MWPRGDRWTPTNVTKAIVVILGALATFIGAAFGGVAGLERLIKAAKDTSTEYALLRVEITEAREEFRTGAKKLEGLDEWRQAVDTKNHSQDERITSAAQLAVKLNGSAPSDGWPESYEGQWDQPPQPKKTTGSFRSKRPFDPSVQKK